MNHRSSVLSFAQWVFLNLFTSSLATSCVTTSTVTRAPETEISAFHLDRLPFSYGVFDTEATSVSVEIQNTVPEIFSKYADISIDDGRKVRTYKVDIGQSTIIHQMPPGPKRVVVTSGAEVKFNGSITGVYIKEIIFNVRAVRIEQTGPRIVIYGDSIAGGGNVNNPSAEAWPLLLRGDYSVIVDALGYRMLYDDASTPSQRSEFASRISSLRPDIIWFAIGANDYALNQWSAEDFGEAYAATLDALHATIPNVTLYAQSPILRAEDGANSLGDDLEDFSRQIATACSTRHGWCIFVDGRGLTFPQPNELDRDGIHLTTKSSAKYAEAVLSIINNR